MLVNISTHLLLSDKENDYEEDVKDEYYSEEELRKNDSK